MSGAGASPSGQAAVRLPPGRHKLTREEVRESQQRRLRVAAAESLAAEGYTGLTTTAVASRAGVSTGTLYRYHADLWECLRDAYEAGAAQLCEQIEEACGGDAGPARLRAGLAAALSLLDREAGLATLLGTEPPAAAGGLWAARRELVARLADLLAGARAGASGDRAHEQRLVAASLALLAGRAREGAAVAGLADDLAAILA